LDRGKMGICCGINYSDITNMPLGRIKVVAERKTFERHLIMTFDFNF
jgi:hypothetical protein